MIELTSSLNRPTVKFMSKHFKTTVLYSVLLGMFATQVVGCDKGIKPEVHKPVKLVKLTQSVNVLQPVFSTNVGSKNINKKDALDMQIGYGKANIVVASRAGNVASYDLLGKRLWSIDVNEQITGGVAYDDASQIAVVSTRSGKVLAINGLSGAVIWQKQLSGSVLTPALISQNRVIVSANDGFLHGLALQSGQPVWQFVTQVPAISVRGTAKPTLLDDKTALIATADGRIHALNVESGIPLWSRRIGLGVGSSEVERMSDVDAMPVVDNNQLYAISYSGQLIGIDLTSGQAMFVNQAASIRTLAVTAQLVVAATLDGKVQAYNRLTGELVWQNDELAYRKLTNPVLVDSRLPNSNKLTDNAANSYLAVGDLDGVIHLIDINKGTIVSRVQTNGALTSLQFADNYLMTQSSTGEVSIWQITR